VATFLPFNVLHPVRTLRLRRLTLALVVLWSLLGLYTLLREFDVGAGVKITMCVIAIYVVASDGAIRLLRSFKA
jgi:phosphatidylcholine synthase